MAFTRLFGERLRHKAPDNVVLRMPTPSKGTGVIVVPVGDRQCMMTSGEARDFAYELINAATVVEAPRGARA